MQVKVSLRKYDVKTPNPPHNMVTIYDNISVEIPENDPDGVMRYGIFANLCHKMGFSFRFYSVAADGIHNFHIVVFGELEIAEMWDGKSLFA